METPEATSMRAPEPKLSKPTRKPATRAAKAEQPKARGADGPEMVKLTVMTPHEYLDQLEDLKRQERRRLSGSGEKKYRQKRTVTYLVNQAIADLLAKSGFKVIRYEE
jgi:cell division septation protein DedD